MRFSQSPKRLAVALFIVACFYPLQAHAWPGKTQRIVDGDTLCIIDQEATEHRIRLYGVDCPEMSQPEGEQALQAVQSFTADYPLEVLELRRDRNGRVIAVLSRPDGMTIQELLLVYGFAWIDERYCKRPECEAWQLLEMSARLSRRGIWSKLNPIPPWKWRRGER